MTVDEGFRSLYEAEFDNVYRAVELMCGDPSAAEEATQEAFARALARWKRLREQTWVAGWVTTTAINVARRQLRRRPFHVLPPRDERDPVSVLDLRSAIGDLPPRQQEAVALHYLLDLPVHEVARLMSCDEGTVKTHLSRARAALARALESGDEPIERTTR
jgi:RNA polymerase sigma factor (sigma-70 family)